MQAAVMVLVLNGRSENFALIYQKKKCFKSDTVVYENKSLQRIKLPISLLKRASYSELPSDISTMTAMECNGYVV